jgi:dephospho-CoA kinase
MIVLGLTGSIAMGKSTAASLFKRLLIPIHDSDRTVHTLINAGGAAIPAIGDAFSGVIKDGAVDREAMARHVYNNPQALRRLEGILHPLVYADQRRFLSHHRRCGTNIVVLDIPLLFETNGDRHCDAVCVVFTSKMMQTYRLLRRPGMTPERIDAIRARQMPDAEKQRRADFLIPSGLGLGRMMREIQGIVRTVTASSAKA